MTIFTVVGLRVEKYVGETVKGHNCDFEYTDVTKEKYTFLLGSGCRGNIKSELTVYETEGECGSGWCAASFGNVEHTYVKSYLGCTHKPVSEFTLEFDEESWFEEYESSVLSYSEYGGCNYYPSGYVKVNMELFKPVDNVRNNGDKRIVHILTGSSDLGKSYIGAMFSNIDKSVLETDSLEQLPEIITHDVVVLGGKNKHFSINDIKSRLFDNPKVVLVNFEESKIQSINKGDIVDCSGYFGKVVEAKDDKVLIHFGGDALHYSQEWYSISDVKVIRSAE